MLDFKVVSAIFRKDMRTYLGNPTGYVFITLFIMATCAVAFLPDEFFTRNLADLATLQAEVLPSVGLRVTMMPAILMLFVPAITMNAWAQERGAGTDELLLTLPVRDVEVVLGKYLGLLGMYTASLALTAAAQLTVLKYLGDPDSGLMFSTFAGYWLMGALFAAIGLLGSILTLNTTVAFILGGVFCFLFVVAGGAPWASALVGMVIFGLVAALVAWVLEGSTSWKTIVAGVVGVAAGVLLRQASLSPVDEGAAEAAEGEGAAETAFVETTSWFEDAFGSLSVSEHFASFGEGVIRLGDVAYFVGGITLMLYLCTFLLGRRHW